jgi:phosphoenolpyruvate carboxykinase (ATP)
VLENVAIDTELRLLDFNDGHLTENTRAAYPLAFIEDVAVPSVGGIPKNVVFLTADAFGVLPPVARLSAEQAMYHFLSGYTSKVGGTEVGLGKQPEVTFSSCFGAPFLPRKPEVYAEMLRQKLASRSVNCWLVNTGWTGGTYGIGQRISLPVTRTLLRAALSGVLDQGTYREDRMFRFSVPTSCPEIDPKMLDPRTTWSDPLAYDRAAHDLVQRFQDNFAKFSPAIEIKLAEPTNG